MRGNSQAEVEGRSVRCSRCGGAMRGRLGTVDEHPFRLLWWECETGHTTDVLPVPEFVLGPGAGPVPRLRP